MTVHRVDIERALDEFISNEEGMKFQGLAVVLAKQRWPEFIACERKWDLGLDAYAKASLGPDGLGKGLACSLTATIDKINGDLKKVKKHFDDVKVLVFATPRTVTNHTAKKWADQIRTAFGYELIVLSREDIITSLMMPSNAAICRNQLGLPIVVEASMDESIQRARLAASEVRANWLKSLRLEGKPYIDLRAAKLDDQGAKTEEILYLGNVRASLLEGRRVVLEAPAGRGKTTTLVRLAKQDSGMVGISFLIDLPAWAKSRMNILDFVVELPSFRSRGLSAENLAALYKVEPLIFLLNGWNEVSEIYVDDAVTALRQLERDYPAAGICVATRTHYLTPPLPGAFRAELLPLTWTQRNEYLEGSLGSRRDELVSKLDNDPVLDQLTRIPFILAEVINIFQSGGSIPTTKIGVLSEVIRLLEQSDEHRIYLQAEPLRRHSEYYLTQLAVQMTGRGTTMVLEMEARPIANAASIKLRDAGQLATLPEPASVLNALCAHHVLERLNYQPDTFRFEHQQFQELYAALFLKRQIFELVDADSKEYEQTFAKDYTNDPKWDEPVRILAEEIGAQSTTTTDPQARAGFIGMGKRLVELALIINPIFAAELSRLCGGLVWGEVRTAVGERLRAWYCADEENNRKCALAGMLATGSGDFTDIILPLLTSDDKQVRLSTYRAGIEFCPTVLGTNWERIVNGWSERARIEFVSELGLHGSNIEAPIIVEHFALTDPSPKVRAKATHALIWGGAARGFVRVLEALDDEAFELAVQDLGANQIPISVRPRALAVWHRQLNRSADPISRLRMLMMAAELGQEGILENLKEQLTQLESANIDNLGELVIRPAISSIKKAEPEWVSHWVANRILDGSLWPDHWIEFVTDISEGLKEKLLETISSRDINEVGIRGIIPMLKITADARLAEAAWTRLCAVRRAMFDSADAPNRTERTIARQLEDLIRALPPNVSVAGLSEYFARQIDLVEFTTVIEVFSRVGDDEPDLRSELQNELRHGLRMYLKSGLPFALSEDDFNGQMKAYLATALARVGESVDATELRRLIQADIERIKNGRAAHARRERGPLARGASISWARWHVRAVASLGPQDAEGVLLELLCEPDYDRYENEAASALARLAMIRDVSEQFRQKVDYRSVWTARAGNQPARFDEERRRRYANAIKERISMLLTERARNSQTTLPNNRLKELAKLLADLDGRESSEFVMKVMALPGDWDSWIKVEAIESLVLSGAELPTEATLEILNPAIDQICAQGLSDHNTARLLVRCLCLLPFVDVPAVGIDRIRQVISETSLGPVALRDLFGALGSSRCSKGLDLLIELAGADGRAMPEAFEQWIDAVAAFGGSKAIQILLNFIDPAADGFDIPESDLRYGEGEFVASRIINTAVADAGVMQRIFQFCDASLSPAKRLLLAKVIERLGTVDAVLAGLNLIDDGSTPSVPYDLRSALENVFLERRPYGKTGSYRPEPRSSNEIRAKLYEMALSDVRRKQSAFALLGQIEVWRLDYGRPSGEPRHPAFTTLH